MRGAANLEELHELSPIQQGLLIESTSAGESDPYLVQMRCRLRGRLDAEALRAAWQSAVDRHETLRTSFHWRGLSHPVQAVHRKVTMPFEVVDVREEEVEALAERDRGRGLDLEAAPLTRVTLGRLSAEDHLLLWTHHHLLLDGWSVALLLEEVLGGYSALARGERPSPAPAEPHSRYVDWLKARGREHDEAFWRERLRGFAAPVELPLGSRPSPGRSRWNAEQAECVDAAGAELLAALRARAARCGVTLATALQAAWALLLRDHSGADDVVYGLTVSTRPAGVPGANRILGPLVNTLPVRTPVPGRGSLDRWLRELHDRQLDVAEHTHSALGDVRRWSDVPGGGALFETAFAFENYPADRELRGRMDGLEVGDLDWAGGSGFPVTMLVVPDGEGTLKLRHHAGRLDAGAARRLMDHYRMLLGELAAAPADLDLADLPSLTPAQRQRVVVVWNAGGGERGGEPVHEAIARHARTAPDAVAARWGAESLDYGELDRRAERVAAALHAAGVARGARVALLAPPTPWMLGGLLGALKAGAAYVPLDPRDPPARHAAVLGAARPAAVLVDPSLAADATGAIGPWPQLRLDELPEAAPAPAAAAGTGAGAAYVLFTSGTTGTPKGVVVAHSALARYLAWCARAFELGPTSRSLAFTSPAVDLSVTALLGPLAAGATVELPDPALGDVDLAALLEAAAPVDLLKLTPSHLELLGRQGGLDALARRPPRHLVVGGENLHAELLRPWREALPDTAIWNEYGPTEATVACCASRAPGSLPEGSAVPIGQPLGGARLYVLDELGRPVPPGVTGELHVGGANLAIGYLGDPALTAERFVPDPFARVPGARMYRTGDLARLDGAEQLVYAGRIDAQVKVRGHRVEPGEVEAGLAAHPGVAEAAVVRREGSTALAAYVVPAGAEAPAPAELAAFLAERLPAHMVPSSFEALDAIPRTAAGKVDRRLLASRTERPRLLEPAYAAPRSATERVLAELWEEALGVDRVGVDDDFHHVGGDSLTAMRVVAQATERLGAAVSAGELMECRTIARLAARIDAEPAQSPVAAAASATDSPPVSAAQSRFFVLHELDPTKAAYNTFGAARLDGPLSRAGLHAAVGMLVARHATLRSVFRLSGDRLTQSFLPPERFALEETDLSGLDREAALERAADLARADARRSFDLAAGPLLRLRLYRVDDGCHVLGLVAHHIVSDGRSFGVMVEELAAGYAAALRGEPAPPGPPPPSYADLARREGRDRESEAASLRYWRERLEGSSPIALTPDRSPPAERSYAAAARGFQLPPDLWAGVVHTARRQGVTPFVALLAALRTVLHRFSGQDDLTIGTPVARRELPGSEAVIGPALNPVVLRGRVEGRRPLAELLERERETVAEALAHANLPFERLIDELGADRDLGRNPLFQVLFDYQRGELRTELAGGVTVRPVEIGHGAARFDLQLDAREEGGTLGGRWTYAADLFDAATIEGIDAALRRVLEAIAADPSVPPAGIELLRAEDRERLEAGWDAGVRELHGAPTVSELFRRQAERTPAAPAVAAGGSSLTYSELAAAAAGWARRLRSLGAGPEERVGVLVERSAELAVAVMASLESGAAYLPLDPAMPDERLRFMVADARPVAILTSADLAPRAAGLGAEPVVIDAAAPPGEPAEPDCPTALGRNAAYVIYTSGSTGRPKGVAIEHEALRNRLLWMQDRFGLDGSDRVLHKTPIGFDVSVWELLWPLVAGACMVMAEPGGERDGAYLAELMESAEVTTAHFVPSLLGAFLEDAAIGRCRALRRVICSGEALTGELRDRFHELSEAELFNLYGPTEAAIDVTAWACRRTDTEPAVPIGTAVANTRIYVLDEDLRLVPPGAVGELCIGGVQVGRGYVGRPALTAASFRPDPFARAPGSRLYRSGDRARYRRDGTIEFLGRVDDQVKVRGQRIELGEVEAGLAAHPGVRECAVTAVGEGADRRLAAYYAAGAARPARRDLEDHLRRRLPAGMVPSFLIELEALPRTPSGKVDRSSLPAPDPTALGAREHAPPSTPRELALAPIWRDVLGVDHPGAGDSFFELGGDSIRALRMVARASHAGLHLRLSDVYLHPTLAGLAAAAEAEAEGTAAAAPFAGLSPGDRARLPAGVADAYPATALQAGMVFEAASRASDPLYNNVDTLHLRAPFDAAALRAAAQLLVDRHDVLRTSLDLESFDQPVQLVHERVAAAVEIQDLRGLEPAERRRRLDAWFEAEKTREWDLSEPPLIRLHAHRTADDELELALPHHHAILDGWSLATLCSELASAYLALIDGREPDLPVLPEGGFRAYVQAERRAIERAASRDYWREVVGDAAAGAFPAWLPFRPPAGGGFRTVELELAPATASGLAREAQAAGVPLKSALLAAHCEAVGALCAREEVLTGIVTDGRLPLPNGDSVLGLFLNSLPFRATVGRGSPHDLMRRVFAAESEMVEHRHVPMERILRDSGAKRLFDSWFNYTNFHLLSDLPRDPRLEVLGRRSFTLAGFPLAANFNLDPETGVLGLTLVCDLGVLPDEQVEPIADLYVRVLESMAAAAPPGRRRPLLSGSALEERLAVSTGRRGGYPRDATIHGLFEEQARQRPEAIALTDGAREIAYGELNERANRLAHGLVARGAGPEAVVALCVERSLEMVVALVAILKAGAAYLPLDPRAPAERNDGILRAAAPVALLAHERFAGRLPPGSEPIWLDADAGLDPGSPAGDPDRGASARNLCYVMTTSGTTGGPKGVRVEHRAVVRLVRGADYVELGPDETLFQVSPLAFDVSTFELWGALLNGGRLVVPPPPPLSLSEIARAVSDNGVTTLWLTAGLFAQVVGTHLDQLGGVRQMLAGGDVVPVAAVRAVLSAHEGCRMINGYGPTEATTFACAHTVPSAESLGSTVPIGRPIANTTAYVCDRDLELLPVGVPGELHLGGDAVARDYHARPGLTAASWLPDPFGERPGGRLYATGDRARYLPDGTIEYLGRLDQQVKLQGQRVEPGEVELELGRHPGVRAAAVVAHDLPEGGRVLVAYVVAGDDPPDGSELRAFLGRRVPDYMVPAQFERLDALPLTPVGKVDRRRLPLPARVRPDTPYVPPRTPLQELLASVCADVFGLDRVGMTDNFFELGGHSLLVMRLASRIRHALGVEVPLREFFRHSTVAGVEAAVLAARAGGAAAAVPPVEPRADARRAPLSWQQQGLYELERSLAGFPLFAMPMAIKLRGELDRDALARAFRDLTERHHVLRSRFVETGGGVEQVVGPVTPVELPVTDLGELPAGERDAEVERRAAAAALWPLDSVRGPLLHAELLRLGSTEWVLLLTLHHAVCDGWSIEVIASELSALYRAARDGEAAALAPLPVQYGDYAAWQRRRLEDGSLDGQLDYWRRRLHGVEGRLDLPTDRPREALRSLQTMERPVRVGAATVSELRRLGQRSGASLFMVLTAVLADLIARRTGSTDVRLGTLSANRNRLETEGLVGLFVNTLVLRFDLAAAPSLPELLEQVRETTIDAFAHQDLPFEALLRSMEGELEQRAALFQHMLILQGSGSPADPAAGLELAPLAAIEHQARLTATTMDLTLILGEQEGELRGSMVYRPDLFDADTVDAIVRELEEQLARLAGAPARSALEGEALGGGRPRL